MLFKEKTKLLTLPVDKIQPNPSQPRKHFSEKELYRLAMSIRENGLLQPVTVRKENGIYYLIAGERRLRATKLVGLNAIPAVVTDHSTEESAVFALIENLQRQNLNMFEEANAIVNLLRNWEITQEAAAKRLGMSQSALSNKLRLLKLEPQEQEEIISHGLTERHARALLKISDSHIRQKMLGIVIEKGLNVSQTEALIDELSIKSKEDKKKPIRTFVAKDIRIFINTIDNAVDTMKTAGIPAEAMKKETDDYIECTVRILKR